MVGCALCNRRAGVCTNAQGPHGGSTPCRGWPLSPPKFAPSDGKGQLWGRMQQRHRERAAGPSPGVHPRGLSLGESDSGNHPPLSQLVHRCDRLPRHWAEQALPSREPGRAEARPPLRGEINKYDKVSHSHPLPYPRTFQVLAQHRSHYCPVILSPNRCNNHAVPLSMNRVPFPSPLRSHQPLAGKRLGRWQEASAPGPKKGLLG